MAENTTAKTKTATMDMTEGNPTRLMLSFMVPMFIGNIFQQLYNMVDSMIVGQFVGADALAAIGATGYLNWMFFALCSGLASGAGIIISHFFGSRDESGVKRTIANTVYLMVITGIIMSILGILLSRPILGLLQTPENIIDDSTTYMRIICSGILFVSLYNGTCSIMRGLGDSRSPLYFLIAASIMNGVLDLLFVVKLGMGVAGAGYATIISQLFSAVSSMLYAYFRNDYFRLNKEEKRYDKIIMEKCIRLGVPLAAQSSLIALSLVFLQSIVNSFGSTVVAAFTATGRIESLVQMPNQSLGTAMSTYTGQNFGAGKQERAKKGVRSGIIIILVFAAVMIPIVQFFGESIMRWFVNDPEVIAMGATGLRITSAFFIPLGLINVYRGFLNGVGDARFSLINGITEMVSRVAYPKPLTMIPAIGVWGIWLGTGITWTTVAIVCWHRFQFGAWRKQIQK